MSRARGRPPADRRRPAAGPAGLRVPAGWEVVRAWGPLRFTTRAELRRPDGAIAEWSLRRHRKRLGHVPPPGARFRGLARAHASSWLIGALFAIGSACFALGSLPPYFDNVDPDIVAATFFVGSLFFTTAAYLVFREAVAAPESIEPGAPPRGGLRGWLDVKPRRLDWWAGLVQLAGTVFFNVSTFAATRDDLTLEQQRHLIWAPDLWGSVCFLVASWLAFSEVSPRTGSPKPRVGWWIGTLNLAGSVAFGAAAIGARYLTTTGEPANIALINLGTFVGALCFLAGAALLPVESASPPDPMPARATE